MLFGLDFYRKDSWAEIFSHQKRAKELVKDTGNHAAQNKINCSKLMQYRPYKLLNISSFLIWDCYEIIIVCHPVSE